MMEGSRRTRQIMQRSWCLRGIRLRTCIQFCISVPCCFALSCAKPPMLHSQLSLLRPRVPILGTNCRTIFDSYLVLIHNEGSNHCVRLNQNPVGGDLVIYPYLPPLQPPLLTAYQTHVGSPLCQLKYCSRITPDSDMDSVSLSDARNASLPVQIRLTFVILLLIHQCHSFVVEICYIYTQPAPLFKRNGKARALVSWLGWHLMESEDPMKPPPTWTWTSRTQWVVINGLSMCFIALLFSIFAFRGAADFQRNINSQCDATVDGDIAGIGVRMAAWIQITMLIFIIGVNQQATKTSNTATKELAGGLVITHLSLGISLAVLLHQGRLSALNAAIGTMVLDAQNVALSVSFSSRDVLAARWEVITISVAQFAGLVWIGLLMSQYRVGQYQTDDCRCFSFFWWGWHDTCSGVPRMETSIFWVYYEFRWLGSVHNWLFGLRYMWDFDAWEGKYAGKADPDMVLNTSAPQLTSLADSPLEPFWLYVPDTVGLSLFRYSVLGLASMAAAELVLLSHGTGGGNEDFTVGQVIAMVIAGITILRALWLFLMAFYKP